MDKLHSNMDLTNEGFAKIFYNATLLKGEFDMLICYVKEELKVKLKPKPAVFCFLFFNVAVSFSTTR